MKTTKKWIALFTALASLAALTLSVHAETETADPAEMLASYRETMAAYRECMNTTLWQDDELYVKSWSQNSARGLVVITDGTELTDENIDLEECSAVTPWFERMEWYQNEGYLEGSPEIEEGTSAYILYVNVNDSEELSTIAREYALTHEYVEEIYWLGAEEYDVPSWIGTYEFLLPSDADPEMIKDFPGLSDLEGRVREGSEDFSESGVMHWIFQANTTALYEVYDEYTNAMLYEKAKEIENTILEEYSDVIIEANACFSFSLNANPDAPIFFGLNSVWETHGDFDADGTADAKDAANILVHVAALGAGKDVPMTEAEQKAADVNHDGTINTLDAAAILRYAASQGSGKASSWLDILR